MGLIKMDQLGLKCPQPVLNIAAKVPTLQRGDILEILADCPSFEKDVRAWCERMKRTLLSIKDSGDGKKTAEIQL